jgi:hypothetical protein
LNYHSPYFIEAVNKADIAKIKKRANGGRDPTIVGAATKHYVVGNLGEVSSHFGIPDIVHFWHYQPANMKM